MLHRIIKNFDAPILQETNNEERSITHFISTEAVDRDGDIVRSDGVKTDAFMKNPVVLWRHDDREPPIGKCAWVKVANRDGCKGLLAKTIFANTDDANEIFELWKGGFLSAASIRFSPIKSMNLDDSPWGPKDFIECELLEYSIVPIPANAGALRLAMKSMRPETQLAIEKALADEQAKSATDEIKALNTKLDSVLERLESIVEAQKSLNIAHESTENNAHTEPAAEATPVETLAEKHHDMQSVVDRLIGGKVSALKGL